MNRYTIYCTAEQTKKALELGAPIKAYKPVVIESKAGGSALSDMKAELQHQFDSLDCNCNEEPSEPMRQTKAWWKFWGKYLKGGDNV